MNAQIGFFPGTIKLRLVILAIALMLLLWNGSVIAQQAIASIDRNPVVEYSAFALTVTSNENLPRDAFPAEQFIHDFEIRSTSVSSSTSIINGERSRTTEWRVILLAPSAGSYEIPSFTIGAGRTNSIQVEVIAATEQAAESRNAFVEASLNTDNPYVQQQLTYTVKLYFAEQLETGSLSLPTIEHASVEQLGQDRQSQEIIDGRRFQVLTRSYGITPRRSGELLIEGVRFDGQMRRTQGSGFSALGRIEPVSMRAPNETVQVRPRPATFVGEWLPSEQVTLEEQWDPESTRYVVGEPITRRIIITAAGVRTEQLPLPPVEYPDHFRVYPDRGQQESSLIRGVPVARSTFTTAIVATEPGEFTLPAVRIPWWNTRTDQLVFAELPERTVHISLPPGGLSVPGSAQAPEALTERAETTATSDNELERSAAAEQLNEADAITYWQLLSIALASGWLLTAAFWIRQWLQLRQTQRKKLLPTAHVPLNVRQSLHALKQACKTNSPKKVRTALLDWHQARTGKPARGLFHIGESSGSEALKTQIGALEAALYSKETQQWQQGAALWKSIQELHQQPTAANADLPHLYPHSR